MVNNGRSSDRADLAPQAVIGPTESSRNEEEEFPCRAPNCDRSFPTIIGRGVHENRAHPDWYDQLKLHQQGVSTKERWSEEERRMLARREAELIKQGGIRFMNQELLKTFQGRTLEAVKKQRQKQDHKAAVEEYLAALETGPGSSSEDSNEYLSAEEEDTRDAPNRLADYLRMLEPLEVEGFATGRLNEICQIIDEGNKEEVGTVLALYLREIISKNKRPNKRPGRQRNPEVGGNSKKRRRAEYARAQDLWKKDPSLCVKRIINDQMDQEPGLPKELMEPFWKAVFTRDAAIAPTLPEPNEELDPLWAPVQVVEIRGAFPPSATAPGPDGLKVKDLKKIPMEVLARIYNIFMWLGRLPEDLYLSRTVLIPKKKGAVDPGDFRPITVSSVLVRTFHKILANRLKVSVPLDDRQRAFRETDGCSDNVMLLDMTLKYHQKKHRSVYVAILDMAKAFDSVTFEALKAVLNTKKIPKAMTTYILKVYEESKTILQHGGWQSEKIHPTCGVKQGDPLSPYIFNMVVDEMLKSLTPEINVDIDGYKINVLAFADDLILVASTQKGLQSLIDQTADFLHMCGLEANANKCATLSIKSIPKKKKTAVDVTAKFKIRGAMIPALKRTSEWKYLGITFTAAGRVHCDIKGKLEDQLLKLSKAPLKPQQRLWALRTIVIPGSLYQLALSDVTYGYLRSIDVVIRKFVRKWLALPHDCPNGYIHAAIEDGGLGIASIRWRAPLERLGRLKALTKSSYISGPVAGAYIEREITKVELRLKDNSNNILRSSEDIDKFWARCLYARFDGKPLENSRQVLGQHKWVGNFTRFLSGRDFVNSCKTRINALPTLARTSRGRVKDRNCRGGCRQVETSNHVIQICHRTHVTRVKRHNAVCNYIAKKLRKKGYVVDKEPKMQTAEGLRKPDIVATLGSTSIIVDAQVLGEQVNLDEANQKKIDYYSKNRSLQENIMVKYSSDTVITTAATFSWRGLWSKSSAAELQRRGIILKSDLKILSSRVLIGGIACFNLFNCTTSIRRGIG